MENLEKNKENSLQLCTFKTPPSDRVMSEKSNTDSTLTMCNGVKILNIDLSSPSSEKKNVKTKKEKAKRIVTTTHKWTFSPSELEFENQYRIIREIQEGNVAPCPDFKFVLQQIHRKIYSYRTQDLDKNIFSPEEFVNMEIVVQKLVDCSMNCYYCREPVAILYEFVREPKQWTLERIDNKFGHNSNNVEIACLSCNLRRRCMYHERFIFTKQLNLKKIG